MLTYDTHRQTPARRFGRRRLLGVAGSGIGIVGLLGACGKSPTSAARTNAGSASPGTPRYGGQLNLAFKGDPFTFDPSTTTEPIGSLMSLTNDSLLGFKTGPDIQYTDTVVGPKLADTWEVPDAQTYTFRLHQGVKFANLPPVNGRDMTSEDVKWSYEYYSRTGRFAGLPAAPVTSTFGKLDRIETPDPHTVVVRFQAAFAPFTTYAATEYLSILAHEILEADGDLSKRTVGTGPWQLDTGASQKGSQWVFKKNPTYFLQGRPYIDRVNWLIIPDDATTSSAFVARQIDMLSYTGLTVDTVNNVKASVHDATEYTYLDPSGSYITMNVSVPPLSDVRVRQAISLAINRDAFIKLLAHGQGQWALAASSPSLFTQAETEQILSYNPAAARRLLGDAGYSDGVTVENIYPGSKYGEIHITKLQALQAQLKDVGINLKLTSVDATSASNRLHASDFQMFMVPTSPLAVNADFDSLLYAAYYPGTPGNYGKINDSQLTPLLEAERREPDPAKRRELWRQAVRRINEVPSALALYYGQASQLWRPYLKNYYPNGTFKGIPIINSWLEK